MANPLLILLKPSEISHMAVSVQFRIKKM